MAVDLWPAIVFALAISIDGFAVGLAYGVGRMIIPWYSLAVVCFTSALAILLSMSVGRLVGGFLSPEMGDRVGALIMVGVGCWLLLEAVVRKASKEAGVPLLCLHIRPLGIVIQILREPSTADRDGSGTISLSEAFALGAALAMDALGAGFGAAIAGFTLWHIPLFVGLFKLVLVSLGLRFGNHWGNNWLGERGALVPGLLLMALGLWKI